MVDNINYKKLVGNIRLHRDLVPERRFLKRNLRHILDSHEHQLQQSTNANPHEDMIANEKRTSGWDYPTLEMLEDLMRGQNPILRLDSLHIRHPKSTARSPKRRRTQTNGHDGLDWLPDPSSDFILPCRVGITVLDTRTTTNTKPPRTYIQSVAATITQDRSTDHFPAFHVELCKPFLIELDKFFVVAEQGTNGFRHWKRTVTAKHSIQIKIECNDSDDTAELLSRLEGRDLSSYDNTPANEGGLKATWDKLPECPQDDHLLTLKRAKGHKSLEMEYKMQASMGWSRKRETPLQRYNQKLAESQKDDTRQLPTPSASDDMDKQPTRFIMSYNYQDGLVTRSTKREGLICPLCHGAQEHPSFDRFRLHLMTYHDHFRFELEPHGEDDSSVARRTLWISLADEETDVQVYQTKGPDEVRMNWVAPSRPFNVSAHVRGTDRWNRPTKSRSNGRRGRAARDRDKDYILADAPNPDCSRPTPEEVQDLPDHQPRKRQVPNVPGVNFYHTTSKQVSQPGEYVAESDENVDESWLEQNQSFGLEELGITGAAQDFTNAFNKHLAREQAGSSLLAKEALVRFARTYREHLQDIDWQRQFRSKLKLLRGAGIVDDDTVSYCIRLVRATSEARTTDVDVEMQSDSGANDGMNDTTNEDTRVDDAAGILQRDRKKWTAGKLSSRDPNILSTGKSGGVNGAEKASTDRTSTIMSLDADPMPAVSVEKILHAKLCICGISASYERKAIACRNPRCVRRDYHLACIGLDRRILGWQCPECVSQEAAMV